MGMFDYITTPDIQCPQCSEPVTGFQSKDGPCTLDTLNFWEVGYFYSSCDSCGESLTYELNAPRPPMPFEAYKLIT